MKRKNSNHLPVLMLFILLLPQAAVALQARPLSPSVVLVLKLVSATHVQPATGIVITDDGLVLVDADFVSTKGELIVLDGGTDIVRNGRPARVVVQSGTGGLAILSVAGLSRPGITLSENTPDKEPQLHMTAFPPAKYIAKGAPPLWTSIAIVQGNAGRPYSVSPSTPQPNLTGPILDNCGYLAGISLADGQQSLEPNARPVTIFAEELRLKLKEIQVSLDSAKCSVPVAVENLSPGVIAPGPEEVTSSESGVKLVGPEVYRPIITRKRLNPFEGALAKQGPAQPVKQSIWLTIPWWLVLLCGVGLAALIWKGHFFYRLYKKPAPMTAGQQAAYRLQTGGVAPFSPLLPDNGNERPRSAPLHHADFPDIQTLTDGCNGVLAVEGFIDGESNFKQYCEIAIEQFSIVVGRGDKDINIDHPSISRAHACLEGETGGITISDLGSGTGTFIKGVPCLEGEVIYMEAGDEVFLGDVQLYFSIISQDMSGS